MCEGCVGMLYNMTPLASHPTSSPVIRAIEGIRIGTDVSVKNARDRIVLDCSNMAGQWTSSM